MLMLVWFLVALGLIWLVAASVCDFSSNEIPNWIWLSLIIFALGARFFYCLFKPIEAGGFGLFYQGIIGLLIFFGLANLFYYSRLFAMGDAKLMMALGALLPFYGTFMENIYSYIYFIVIFLFAGSLYGLIFSVLLVSWNWKAFKKEFLKRTKKDKQLIFSVLFIGIVLCLIGIKFFELIILGVLVMILPLLYFYAKAIDECCMIKKVKASKLSIGDWLYKDVKIGRKVIKATWDGLSEDDIKFLKKKSKNKLIKIRQGIAFGATFLIAFIVYVLLYFRGFF
jgi:Flp pilus assembly protein protease CpaA